MPICNLVKADDGLASVSEQVQVETADDDEHNAHEMETELSARGLEHDKCKLMKFV